MRLTLAKLKLNAADIAILLLAVILTAWLYERFWFTNHAPGSAETLSIQVAQQTPQKYSLKDDRIIVIEGHKGRSHIEIKQGKARFIHSVCRNQFCVFHGWLSTPGDTIACLPNRISMTLQGRLNEYDALAGGQ